MAGRKYHLKGQFEHEHLEGISLLTHTYTFQQALEDHGYDRAKSLKHISDSTPLDSKYQKLWTFLMAAVQEFPESDSTKGYSESTSISSFILPSCKVFMSIPGQRVFLNL